AYEADEGDGRLVNTGGGELRKLCQTLARKAAATVCDIHPTSVTSQPTVCDFHPTSVTSQPTVCDFHTTSVTSQPIQDYSNADQMKS
ncbi:hypothetical protein BaRGS_00021886, partial [Batillaria attramentaria]